MCLFSPEAAWETWLSPISRSQLVPIAILVSSTATPTKPRSHQGRVCVLSGQVNHPSIMPAAGLKLTDQDRVGDTLSEGLNGSGGTQRCSHNPTTKSSMCAARSPNGQIRNRRRNLVSWRASCGSQAQGLFAAVRLVLLKMHLHHRSQSSRTIRCTSKRLSAVENLHADCRLQGAGRYISPVRIIPLSL